ncbi:membrane protein [Kineosporia sp. NBRC 101677]|uniref:MMPL family transporter n=1 Tax=Kineosporia sp. NBRC 101677 TaxID=3032197 RepID=UPI0024A01AF0|nr:MMPL family transporter [Kineosporia sp. NBRC 101677]GLY19478.1 membrane protein [Kineosporia sp. NBRC 101677]
MTATEPSEAPPRPQQPRTTRLTRLAGWSQRHHWWAIGLWALILASVTVGSAAAGTDYNNDFSLPGTESQELLDAYAEHSPQQRGDSITVVLQAEDGIAARTSLIDPLLADLRELPHVAAVQPPDPRAGTVSDDGTVALATVLLDDAAGLIPFDDKREILDTALEHGSDDLRVEASGEAVREIQEQEGGGGEGAGVLAALIILVFLFGSLLAAALPLITALFAVGTTFAAVALLSHVTTIPDYTPPVLMLVGLGVGIDYALLVFARYRSELLHGADRETATRTALDTAGRSVLFAGATVVIALLGLYTLGLGALEGVALGVTLTVLMTMLASLTLLPALLHIFGRRIERSVHKHAERARRRGREPGRRWRAWADLVQRRPVPALLVAVIALLALSAPALDLRLGFADEGNDPAGSTTREAYELVTRAFGPGANGPLVVVTPDGDEASAQAAFDVLSSHPAVAEATPPQASENGFLITSLAFPAGSPQDGRTADLVGQLRADLPEGVLVGGPTAATVDFSTAVGERFPLFVGSVVGLSALLLLMVFRSVAIAVKAAVLNLLSIGAALGVMVLVFQHGRLWAEPGPIEAFVPVMIFAIVFGLSMDYEVFLVSRMHEEWTRTGDATTAVREGLAGTGSVITAAAAIMIVVFGAFVLSPSRMLQMMGLGMATAVLLDALVIRCLIVPAVMRLLGDRAWWAPRRLQRTLPGLRVE